MTASAVSDEQARLWNVDEAMTVRSRALLKSCVSSIGPAARAVRAANRELIAQLNHARRQ